jgi:molybdopterin converting factor subunit 1
MKICLVYFAAIKDKVSLNQEDMELQESGTVRQLLELFREKYPQTIDILKVCRVAVNQDFVDLDHCLCENDEVAFIPPVAGGENQQTQPSPLWIQKEALKLDPILEHLSADHIGAQVIMMGTVRDHNEGQSVENLKYEAYVPMVQKVLAQIMEEAKAQYPDARLAASHRIDQLAIGERAVIIGASSPHRDEAFKACRYVIEALKKNAPIWKYETRSDGQTWIGLGP